MTTTTKRFASGPWSPAGSHAGMLSTDRGRFALETPRMGQGHDLPYFDFYPRDFLADGAVAAMSPAAVGAHSLLMCQSWFENPPGTIPCSSSTLARWSRVAELEWDKVSQEVLAAWTKVGVRYRLDWLADSFQKASKRRAFRIDRARSGGLAKAAAKQGASNSKAPLAAARESASASVSGSENQEGSLRGEDGAERGPKLPTALVSPAFVEAWRLYEQHREAKNQDQLTPMSVQTIWMKMSRWGMERAIRALEFTIEKNARNIIEPGDPEPRRNGTNGPARKPLPGEPGGAKIKEGVWE